MFATLSLPRLVFGAGALGALAGELTALGVRWPLIVSDRGLERAGTVAAASGVLPGAALHLDVPEHPTLAGADAALAAYREAGCDAVVALGGGSVIDTAKFVAALAGLGREARAADLQGRPERIDRSVHILVAIPTTVGTGSESSPVAALHTDPGTPAIGTRSAHLVPRVAICDPDLARTLSRRLIAATGIDALSHCLEGFFAGGAAIHKGLGPAHAVAVACGDQHVHHGLLVAAALPLTVALVAPHVPAKADRAAAAMGLGRGADIPDALLGLNATLGLPAGYREAGYLAGPMASRVDLALASHFNRTSPYAPSRDEYQAVITKLLA